MVIIRPATEADLPHLPQIEQQAAQRLISAGMTELFSLFAGYTMSSKDFQDYHRAGHLWAALAANQPVGFIAVSRMDNNIHIDEVDVLPEYGGQGVGRRLIETVCEWARQQNLAHVTLSTQRDVPWNAPYYARMGFEIMPEAEWTEAYRSIRKHEAELGFPLENRVLMKRTLTASRPDSRG